jgi:hypothetical protein
MSPSSPWHFTATLLWTGRLCNTSDFGSSVNSYGRLSTPPCRRFPVTSRYPLHNQLVSALLCSLCHRLSNLLSNCQYAQSSTVSVHSLCLSTSCRTIIDPIQHRKLDHSLSTTAWDAPPLATYAQHREFSGGLIGDAMHTQPNRHGGLGSAGTFNYVC